MGEPLGSLTTSGVASPVITLATSAGVAAGLTWRYLATMPVTCGAAIEVPSHTSVLSGPPIIAERMPTPGANRSTPAPKLEKLARLSLPSVAATVIASGTLAGPCWETSLLSLPAETTTVIPLAITLRTAFSLFSLGSPPRLMLTTAGFCALAAIQSSPPMMFDPAPVCRSRAP